MTFDKTICKKNMTASLNLTFTVCLFLMFSVSLLFYDLMSLSLGRKLAALYTVDFISSEKSTCKTVQIPSEALYCTVGAHCIMYAMLFINKSRGILFQHAGGLMVVTTETIFLIVLLILLTARAALAFHVFTLSSSHLRENHTCINLEVQQTM